MRKVRDGASKGQGSRGERWRFVVGKAEWGTANGDIQTISGCMIGSCENALRMAYLDAGRGAVGKIV